MPIGDVDPGEYLVKQEMVELKKLFKQYDVDGSGSVSSSELAPMFSAMGLAMKPWQIDAIVKEYAERYL